LQAYHASECTDDIGVCIANQHDTARTHLQLPPTYLLILTCMKVMYLSVCWFVCQSSRITQKLEINVHELFRGVQPSNRNNRLNVGSDHNSDLDPNPGTVLHVLVIQETALLTLLGVEHCNAGF